MDRYLKPPFAKPPFRFPEKSGFAKFRTFGPFLLFSYETCKHANLADLGGGSETCNAVRNMKSCKALYLV